MLIISHRVNTIDHLINTPHEYGVEIDLRPQGNKIILHHDPFCEGEDLEDWLRHYKHAMLILNTKAEGMETRLIELMNNNNIENYFFLDLSVPFLIKYMKKGVRKIAVRFSEYEPLEYVMQFADKLDWVWIDCFSDWPLNPENLIILKKHFKLCLVSPELQGLELEKIKELKGLQNGIDAVCTKRPDLWA